MATKKAGKQKTDAAAAWVARLGGRLPPVLPDTPRALDELLRETDPSMRSVGRLLAGDPAFCFHVFRDANALSLRREVAIRDLEHALSLLGVARLRSLAAGLPVIDVDSTDPGLLLYRELLAVSHHAATQVESWLTTRRRANPREGFWMAMLWLAPAWSLALAEPARARRLARMDGGGDPRMDARIRQTLGCPWLQYAANWFHHFALHRFMEPVLHGATQDSPRLWANLSRLDGPNPSTSRDSIRHETTRLFTMQDSTFICLGNLLAVACIHDWYDRRSRRWKRVTARLLQCEDSVASARIHTGAARSSREFRGRGTHTPGARLLLPPPPPPPPYRPARRPDMALIRQAVQALSGETGPPPNLLAILQTTLDAVHRGLGLPRALVAVYRPRERSLSVQLASGFEAGDPLPKLVLQVEPGDLFNHVVEKAAPVWFRNENRARLLRLMPPRFLAASAGNEFIAAPIVANGRGVAVVYADAGDSGLPITPAEFKTVRTICESASRGLEALSRASA